MKNQKWWVTTPQVGKIRLSIQTRRLESWDNSNPKFWRENIKQPLFWSCEGGVLLLSNTFAGSECLSWFSSWFCSISVRHKTQIVFKFTKKSTKKKPSSSFVYEVQLNQSPTKLRNQNVFMKNKHFEGSCELLRFDAVKLLHFKRCFCSLLYKYTQN